MKRKVKNDFMRFVSLALIAFLMFGMFDVKFGSVNYVNADENKSDTWDGSADTSWYVKNPGQSVYYIETAEELAGMAELTEKGESFAGVTVNLETDVVINQGTLTADEDYNGYLDGTLIPKQNNLKIWNSIGGTCFNENRKNVSSAFCGTFDGHNHTVSGIYAKYDPDDLDSVVGPASYGDLFGYAENAVIKNVRVTDTVMISHNIERASIVRQATDSVIENCYSNAVIFGAEPSGGICGQLTGSCTVDNCTFEGKIFSWGFSIGGIVGKTLNKDDFTATYLNDFKSGDINNIIKNCENKGLVCAGHHAGGIVGFACADTLVINCVNNGEISGSRDYNKKYNTSEWNNYGGIAGGNNGLILQCVNYGTINGVVNNGGICGYNRKGMIDGCFNLGTVNGTRYSGGIYGGSTDGITENCFNAGDVNSAKDYSGGIAGGNFEQWNMADRCIKNSYNIGSLSTADGTMSESVPLPDNVQMENFFYNLNTYDTSEGNINNVSGSTGLDIVQMTDGTLDYYTGYADAVNIYGEKIWNTKAPIINNYVKTAYYPYIDVFTEDSAQYVYFLLDGCSYLKTDIGTLDENHVISTPEVSDSNMVNVSVSAKKSDGSSIEFGKSVYNRGDVITYTAVYNIINARDYYFNSQDFIDHTETIGSFNADISYTVSNMNKTLTKVSVFTPEKSTEAQQKITTVQQQTSVPASYIQPVTVNVNPVPETSTSVTTTLSSDATTVSDTEQTASSSVTSSEKATSVTSASSEKTEPTPIATAAPKNDKNSRSSTKTVKNADGTTTVIKTVNTRYSDGSRKKTVKKTTRLDRHTTKITQSSTLYKADGTKKTVYTTIKKYNGVMVLKTVKTVTIDKNGKKTVVTKTTHYDKNGNIIKG